MTLKPQIRNIIIEIICMLFVLLFVYAAVSKILDFENFQVQLGQSPLLSAYARWVSYMVPIIEITIAILLCIPRLRLFGLFAAFSLMVMFTSYIFIILHFSSFVPCSCGGVLAKMSWNAHLAFNILFVFLAAGAIVLRRGSNDITSHGLKFRSVIMKIGFLAVASIVAVVALFISSEKIMHEDNPFIRRFPSHPAEYVHEIDLKYNSYYFAGSDLSKFYLGNFTTPATVRSIDQSNYKQQYHNITLDAENIYFKKVTVMVRDSSFYLFDGSVPVYLTGSIKNWKINDEFNGIPFFTRAVAVDDNSLVFRSNNAKNAANVIGVFNKKAVTKTIYCRDLLQKQVDGIFDTDGILLYSSELRKIIYLYYYRNEFIVADQKGGLSYRGHTIDTIKHAKIKVASLNDDTERAMSAPSFIVNANAAVYKNLLFVNSKIKGSYESNKLWERACIIDVYELKTNKYLLSFPIYNIGNMKLNSFAVTENNLYALIGSRLAVYRFNQIIKKEMLSR
ncbi:putative membrane protein YphA (DoxX/SURF4 family) [Flavobacterium nitrogenifigens]|uniref:Membrane protein YphA (DoxX/SURF4 family) n=2 Tax=Flavobacterium TaxID=237 RepID=A0ABR6QJU5_9FLAO|nr:MULTISPECIES: MauE/DoxX family redox-associated membrane protein [Flavobacterium]MBB4804560.1 putative membrane protein YphA (DoxX/SURF4 family) [Flavobacterium nitrogenifigens]MBB6389519.1 putative membrane protein YphA (DoxX/SURF4 family) [Flavobacterium notoginsengisoli]